MPFLNDLLEQTRRDASSSAALSAENCHTRAIVETHLRSEDTLQSRFRFDVAAVMQVVRNEVLGQSPRILQGANTSLAERERIRQALDNA